MSSPALHVSASSLRTLRDCPREFAHRYLLGTPREDRAPALILGSAVHRALECFYTSLMLGKLEPTADELSQIAAIAIAKDLVDDVPVNFGKGEDAEWLVEEAYRVIDAFMESPYRPTKVLGVEMRFALPPTHPSTGEVIGDFEEMVIGFFDLVCLDNEGNLQIIDHKVSKRFAPPKSTIADLQASLYCFAGEELFQRPVRFFHQVLVRTKVARVELIEVPRSPEDAGEAVEAVWSGLEQIHHAVSHPAQLRLLGRTRGWKCASCAYRTRCATTATAITAVNENQQSQRKGAIWPIEKSA